MADRLPAAQNRTERSAEPALPSAPSIREFLQTDLLLSGRPEVLLGADSLERRIRWVHIADSSNVAGWLTGGELLLVTGAGWPPEGPALHSYLVELLSAGAAAVVLELGSRFTRAPVEIVEACRALAVPLVVLHEPIPFVQVTALVHRRIIAEQSRALQARDDVRDVFTRLSLRGAPVDLIVEEIAQVLRTGVLLEDLDHRLIVQFGADDAVDGWRERSLDLHKAARGPGSRSRLVSGDDEGWLITPVEARGRYWGNLVAQPGAAHPAGRVAVLEQASIALALNRLSDDSAEQWTRRSHALLFDSLLDGRYRDEAYAAGRLEAAGFPLRESTLTAVAFSMDGIEKTRSRVPHLAAALRGVGAEAIVSFVVLENLPQIVGLVSLPDAAPLTEAWVAQLARAFGPAVDPDDLGAVLVVGRRCAPSIESLLDTVALVARSSRARPSAKVGGIAIVRPSERPLQQLMIQLKADERVRVFAAETLAPLLEYDARNDGDLLTVLWALASHPGSKSRAAQASLLSRSAFYQRLALIEDLLGVDLTEGDTITTLHAALLAHRAIDSA